MVTQTPDRKYLIIFIIGLYFAGHDINFNKLCGVHKFNLFIKVFR